MAAYTLACSDSNQGLDRSHMSNPFATPTINPADLPSAPEPVARAPSRSPRQICPGAHTRPMTLHGSAENEKPAYPYKSESMSSSGGSSAMTPISSIDLEKTGRRESDQKRHQETSRDRHSRDQTSRDPEKGGHGSPTGSRDHARRTAPERVAYLEDDEADADTRRLQEKKAAKILFFLSGPCVILSFLNALWTIISLIITSMAQPVRLCARRPTFGQQLGGLLGPALNLQLKCIYTPLPPHADEDTSYRPGMLLAVQLLSPFLSLGMMLAAWIVAVFWFASAVVGDPSGTDRGGDDGRDTVLTLRNWWEHWLKKSIWED